MSASVQNFRVNGIITAQFTPFKENGELDLERFESYVDHIVEFQNKAVFANGTTGEGLSMTLDERKVAACKWVEVCKGRVQVILNVSATNLKDAINLATHAQSIGVDAIAAHSPLFYTPSTVDVLVECMKQIAAAAPITPFYYYDINFMTNTNFDNGEVFRKLIERVPTFRGMKQSSREVAHLVKARMASQDGKYEVITGNELLLPGLPLGVRIPVCLTFAGKIFTRMVEAFDRGDMTAAFKEQEKIQMIQSLLKKYGGGAKKAMSELVGAPVGPNRLPMMNLTTGQKEALAADMERLEVVQQL